ncbi:MAG: molybdopterin molybdotransferase [Frankiaceae bacterium]|nr:molybdopterin molybdotransferase [Frankiaceae bacterium]
MIDITEFAEFVLADVKPIAELELTLLDAHGSVLAQDVAAVEPLPAFDRVSYDGYAVRMGDITPAAGGSPVRLHVVGTVDPGASTGFSVQEGMAVRVRAGSAAPPGSETIVPSSWTDEGAVIVEITRPTAEGSGIQRAGSELAAGAVALAAGTYLRSAQIGLLAAVGVSRAVMHPRPRVVVLASGAEFVQPGAVRRVGELYDANSLSLTTAALEAGALAYRVGLVPDSSQLLDTLEDQLVRADCVIATVGPSAASQQALHDVVRRLGTVRTERLAVEPGGSVTYGRIGFDETVYFGLPGDPASALVAFELLVRPALRRMLGSTQVQRPVVRARLTTGLRSSPGVRSYVPAWLDVRDNVYVVEPTGSPAQLASYGRANALVVIDAETTEVPEGTTVTALLLERRNP